MHAIEVFRDPTLRSPRKRGAMSSGCKSSLSCVDAREPVRANYKILYKWPESDVEFVKSMASGRRGETGGLDERRKRSAGPSVVDSYSCRQLYLRSYTFTKEESVPEKTKRCLRKVKETAAAVPLFSTRNTEKGGSVDMGSKRRRKEEKENCANTRKLREMTHSALHAVFHRLLFCTASVDVVD
ncbi:unnamed protein product [Musa acuminata subsp. malaccensis]|uniref:(wild Malaysian banana) hypothetical protein n=1 Tax=Musa acuminata subsp. malaccensis TaxID=214687 RepID=A0A804K9B2_MUSAM|nr:unnamed protein product [Musa acuminata subsp. malaccensis]